MKKKKKRIQLYLTPSGSSLVTVCLVCDSVGVCNCICFVGVGVIFLQNRSSEENQLLFFKYFIHSS